MLSVCKYLEILPELAGGNALWLIGVDSPASLVFLHKSPC